MAEYDRRGFFGRLAGLAAGAVAAKAMPPVKAVKPVPTFEHVELAGTWTLSTAAIGDFRGRIRSAYDDTWASTGVTELWPWDEHGRR